VFFTQWTSASPGHRVAGADSPSQQQDMFADLCQVSEGQWMSVPVDTPGISQIHQDCQDLWRGPGHVCSRAIALYIRSGPVTTSTWNLATAPTLDILGHSSLLKTGKNCQEMTTNVLKKSTCLLNFWLVSVFKMHRNEIRCPQLPNTKGNHFSHRSAIGTCYSTVKEFCHSTMFFLHHGSSKKNLAHKFHTFQVGEANGRN
jgi:hypothetical protein